ncbi:MAG TPA: acyl-CoA desaturase [Bacteroidetes bacterium]|nr:acyl-CoA desaturase [Bacteroidota bacterium]
MAQKIRFVNASKSEFFPVLKKRMDQYFEGSNRSRNANGLMVFKIVFYLTGLIGSWSALIFAPLPVWGTYIAWGSMGLFAAFIGLGICHDAIHGSLFKSKQLNRAFSFLFNIVGANDYIWDIMHNKIHHTYTNIEGVDEDLKSAPFLRLSPHMKRKPIHRFQHWIAVPAYGLASLSWVFLKDFVKFSKKSIGIWPTPKHPRSAWIRLFVGKAIYYTLFIVMPAIFVAAPWYHIVLGFLFMHYLEGMTLAVIFMMAHVVEETHFPIPDEAGKIHQSWAAHQLYTTANFATGSAATSFFCGGLNFQVEHHLFPNVCHVHFPAMAKIVKATAAEYNLPYYDNHSLASAFQSHIRLLKKLGNSDEGFGNIGIEKSKAA